MSKFLNELQGNELLSSYNIPMAKSTLCKNSDEVNRCIEEFEFPIVMKILSSDIIHKTEAKCVFVGVKNENEAKQTFNTIIDNAKAYKADAIIQGVLIQEMAQKGLEVIIGMKTDPQFGPVIMVGTGGIYVEVFNDISLRILPISKYDAYEMLKETKLYEIINGARGTIYDIETLIDALLKLSKLIEENPNMQEIDINPFFLYEKGKGGKGVDALISISE